MNRPPARRRAGAFTLVELLLAMALLAMLVTAMFTFVFSMGEIWGRGSGKRLFDQHVNAVTRHVESLLRRGAWPKGGVVLDEPFTIDEVKAPGGANGMLLGFILQDGDRLLQWPGAPLPEVSCHLAIDRELGLVLYWRSKLETGNAGDPPRVVTISPFATRLDYSYFDANRSSWSAEPAPRKNSTGNWLVPDRLVLTFKQGGYETHREITVPPGGGFLAF